MITSREELFNKFPDAECPKCHAVRLYDVMTNRFTCENGHKTKPPSIKVSNHKSMAVLIGSGGGGG